MPAHMPIKPSFINLP